MALLILQDGTEFSGESFGAKVDSDGEVVFNTGMVGYPESLTDPSYRGQILTFTYPLIGNYGVPGTETNQWGFSKNFESEDIHVRGVIVSQASQTESHHASVSTFDHWLEHHGIPGITGIDTRALTKKLRETGVMLGRIVQDDQLQASSFKLQAQIEDPNLSNLVAEVSCDAPITYEPKTLGPRSSSEVGSNQKPLAAEALAKVAETHPLTVIAYDCGMKRNIIRSFLKRGVRVVRVPWNFDLASYQEKYDGVFFSNGPGDPKMCVPTIQSFRYAIEQNIPSFGICLGNQLLALALGCDTYKLKYGHRGANQPCIEEHDGKQTEHCIITSQNHGFAVDDAKLPKGWHVWWRNANDGTVEGLRHESGRFASVQFHPESTPGPEDANYLFDTFVEYLKAQR